MMSSLGDRNRAIRGGEWGSVPWAHGPLTYWWGPYLHLGRLYVGLMRFLALGQLCAIGDGRYLMDVHVP